MSNVFEDLGIEVEESVMNYGENSIGLADFMDVDVSDIEANDGGFDLLPTGVYKFAVDSMKVSTINRKLKETNEDVKIPSLSIKCKVEEIVDMLPDENGNLADVSKVIGRYFFHNISLPSYDGEKYARAVGQVKSLAQKLAPEAQLSDFKSMLQAIAGKEFTAKISHRKYKTKDDAEGEKSGVAENLELKSVRLA